MKAGLDFPFIGWYLSMKKYVKFPEIYQGPGRAFLLYLGKIEPFIAFFGQAPFAVAFKSIRRQVLEDAGKMIDSVKASTGFNGSKKPDIQNPDSLIGQMIGTLNTSVEILFRQNPKITKNFGTVKDPSENAIKKLIDLLYKTRSSKHEFEHSQNLKNFIFELHAFPFYKGSLEETWAYCDRYLKLHKKLEKGTLPKKTSEEDLLVIKDIEKMKLFEEFFQIKRWLGSVPRLLLKNMGLEMHGIHEIGDAINSFILKNDRMPQHIAGEPDFAESKLRAHLDQFMSSSSRDSLIERFSFETRTVLDNLISTTSKGTIEEDIDDFVKEADRLPDFIYSKLARGVYTHQVLVEQNLAKRIEAFLRTGKLKIANLDAHTQTLLDQSIIYQRLVDELINEMEIITDPAFHTVGNKLADYTANLSLEVLEDHKNYKILKSLEFLPENSFPHSRQRLKRLQELISNIHNRSPSSLQNSSNYGKKKWFTPFREFFEKTPFSGVQFKL